MNDMKKHFFARSCLLPNRGDFVRAISATATAADKRIANAYDNAIHSDALINE